MRSLPFLAVLALVTSACGSRYMTPAVSASTPPVDQAAATGLAFAQAHCSQCHAVVPLRISPNPEAPPFETVVNVPGLTDVTLKTFLRDSHNFPEIMNFDIDPEQIDALAAYMLTLRNSD